MGAVRGNTVIGHITAVAAGPIEGTSTVTSDQFLDDSPDRFEDGTLTDSAGRDFPVRSSSTGANFVFDVYNQADGTRPALGDFGLVDDDLLRDGQDVPMPDTSTLERAMAEAYVKVEFDINSDDDVPFVGNVEQGQVTSIVAGSWNSRQYNSNRFWVAYVLGAFQGWKARDMDPNSEIYGTPGPQAGVTDGGAGGSLIYLETIRDGSPFLADPSVAATEQDTVVHEVGHAVASSGLHPVTGADSDPVVLAGYSRYKPDYLGMIRAALKPLS